MKGQRRFERGLAVVGAAALLIIGFDSVTYAATGSSLLLGRVNKETAVTTVQNTGKGPALNLLTKSASTAPFSTNATGLVKNLYAARAANSDKLGGQTLAQIQAAAKGATGPAGPPGAAGTPGAPGAPGAPGSARAFGYVNADGTLSFAKPSTLTVTNPMAGLYCITVPGVDPATSVVLVETDYHNDTTTSAIHAWGTYSSSGCGFTALAVETGETQPGSPTTSGVVSLVNEPFVFMVP